MAAPADTRLSGVVARIVENKGFGFIRAADGKDYFFHSSAASDEFSAFREGSAVTFSPGKSAKGPRAELVELE